MKIILPYFVFKYFYKYSIHTKWMVLQSYKFKFYPIVISNSFKALLPYLKKSDDN